MHRNVNILNSETLQEPGIAVALADVTQVHGLTTERLRLMVDRPDSHVLFTEDTAGDVTGVASLHVQPQVVGVKAWADIITTDTGRTDGYPLMEAIAKIAEEAGVVKLDAVRPVQWGNFVHRGTGFYELDPRVTQARPNAHMIRLDSSHITPRLLADLDVLVTELSGKPKPKLTKEYLAKVLDDKTHHVFGMFDPAGKLIGTLSLFVQYEFGVVRGWIEDVVRHPDCRGQNIGAALVQHGIAVARQLGIEKLQLTSNPARGTARDLYVEWGFHLLDSSTYRLQDA